MIDVYSRGQWPSNELSNFFPHAFILDGKEIASMEGLLQAFTWPDIAKQNFIIQHFGYNAKTMGNPAWRDRQVLYWNGEVYDRHEDEYQHLLDRAYSALLSNQRFQRALKATGNKTIRHTMGGDDPTRTILTEYEFCSRLMLLRTALHTK